MIPTIEDLKGTWVSEDFPNYNYNDGFELTFHFGKYATLYFSKGFENNRIISEGPYEIEKIEDAGNENFNFIIDGRAIDLQKSIFNAKLYISQ